MKIKVSGCSGAEFPGHRPSSFLLNGRILFDTGRLTNALDVKEELNSEYIFLTHSHLDHIMGIPRAARRATGGRTGMQAPLPKPKPKAVVVRPGTTPKPNGGFTIETPAQIEARVKRMADEAYNRQKTLFDEDAAAMRLQAEGRQKGLQAAYEAAAKANAGMGADVQAGWNLAGQNISGLAQTATGGVRDALLADLASTEAALARVGAGGTGFDALSQTGVEQYRGGVIPGEFDLRMGGVGRQFANEAGIALNNYGLQTGHAQYGKEDWLVARLEVPRGKATRIYNPVELPRLNTTAGFP